MSHLGGSNHDESSQKLQVWCCDHCRAVHFKAGNVLLNFSRTEFTELTHAVMEIYSQEFGALEFYRMINSINQPDESFNQDDDILLSQTIA
jgi:hypothetical protein